VSVAQVIHGEFGSASVEPTEILTPSIREKCSVAALNLSPKPGDVEGNLLLAERAIIGAKRAHPDLGWIVLPELFTSGYSDLASVHRYAEDAEEGVSVRFFASLARDLGLYVAYGRAPRARWASATVRTSSGPMAWRSPIASGTSSGRPGSITSSFRGRSFRS
jgi:hypothetical protein